MFFFGLKCFRNVSSFEDLKYNLNDINVFLPVVIEQYCVLVVKREDYLKNVNMSPTNINVQCYFPIVP